MNHNFDLRLAGSLLSATAEVLHSPIGQTPAPATLPCSAQPDPLADPQAAGRALWRCAFGAQPIAELWRASVALSDILRLRLVIDSPELATLPWELLYDETLARFLALDGRTPVTRFIRLPLAPLPWPAGRTLRLLYTGASPAELPTLNVAGEWAGIEAGLAPLVRAKKLETSAIPAGATLPALLAALRRGIDVWHFAGHGTDTGLLFADEQGRLALADAGTLGQMLAGEGVRLAVLNACRTGAGGGQAVSVAGALVRAGVPAVVAMQEMIPDAAAQAFATAFYDTIAVGQAVDRAVTAGRKAILATGSTDWWAPVLYMRTAEGKIWEEPPAAQGTQITVRGDVIQAAGPVATHGSAINTGSGIAVAGSGITVIQQGPGGSAFVSGAAPPGGPGLGAAPAWDDTLTALQRVLAALYPGEDQARYVADRAGLPAGQVTFSGAALSTWYSLLRQATLQEMVPAIIAVAQADFPRNQPLADAAAAYQARHPA